MTKIGAHVSIAGGVENAPQNAHDLKCDCFQMFTRSPRGGQRKKLILKNFLPIVKNTVMKLGKII